ncbi:MAG: glycosyltransferase family 39 protein [Anaerolineae bacterium]
MAVHRPAGPQIVKWLPLAVAWIALALRVAGLTAQSLWRDEVDTLLFATRPLAEALQMFRQPGQNGPLFFLLLRPWLAMAGASEFALRFPSALAGTLAVPASYVLALRLAGRKTAALTALLMALAPYLVWYGQEARMYALLTLLITVSLWLTVAAVQQGGWWRWQLLYLVTTVAFYIHVLAALIIPVQVLWLLLAPAPGRTARRWRAIGLYLMALLLPYLPLAVWQADMLRIAFQTGHRFIPLGDILLILGAVFSLGVLPEQRFLELLAFMVTLTAGVLLGGYQAWRQRVSRKGASWRLVVMLLIWLLLPPPMTYGISLRVPIFTERYLIWTMPAFLMLCALGVGALARFWRPLGLILLGAMVVFDLGAIARQTGQPIKSDFRSAAGFVMQHLQPGDRLVYQIPYIRYTFTYYSSGRGDPRAESLPWVDGPYTNHGMSEAEVAAWMARGVGDAAAVWLIASEAPMWDARGLTEQWLNAHGTAELRAEFARVTVTRYVLHRP